MSGHARPRSGSRTKVIGAVAAVAVVTTGVFTVAIVRSRSTVGSAGFVAHSSVPSSTASATTASCNPADSSDIDPNCPPTTSPSKTGSLRATSPPTTTRPAATKTSKVSKRTLTAPAATAPVTSGRACTAPVWRTSSADAMWDNGGYVVHNNMWNASGTTVSQSLAACSFHSWSVTATANNSSGDAAVKTYPNVHVDYHNWTSGKEPVWSSFHQLRSTFAAAAPRVGIYNVAYDIWMNGVPGNREIMIWTDNYRQVPAGSKVGSASLSGITWDVWATGSNDYLAFVPRSKVTSGSLDLKAMIDWLVARGRVPANSTLGQICFGVEIVSTDNRPATFTFTNFSVTSS